MRRLRVVLSICGAAGALGLGLNNADWPAQEFWIRNGALVPALLLLVFLGSLTALFEALGGGRRAKADALELAIQDPLKALFINLLDIVGADQFRTLGVHAFLLKWRPSFSLRPIRRELREAGEVQLRSTPKSGVRWTKGKGLIGICWRLNQDVNADLDKDWKHYRDLPEDPWNALPEEARYGLSFQEFQRTRDYKVVVASPIQNKSGKFKGCISVDSTAELYDALWAIRSREAMQDAAKIVSHLAGLS